MGRELLVAVALMLCGCSGNSDDDSAGEPTGVAQGATCLAFDLDATSWMVTSEQGEPSLLAPADMTDRGQVIHAALERPLRGSIATHEHADLTNGCGTFAFSVRASRPVTLNASITGLVLPGSYWTDVEAGTLWNSASVSADSAEFKSYELPLEQVVQPAGSALAAGPSVDIGTMIHFLLDETEPVDVWLDGVAFR